MARSIKRFTSLHCNQSVMAIDQSQSSQTPNHVIDYPARDMTITVAAEITVGELQRVLASENQQLPVDPACEEMTISDMVAFDVSGPRQYGYGTLRDYVIGTEACDGKGRVFHAGGRVVKNVAGYDLCRLLIGAEGKLGTLRKLTFKLKPLPLEQHLSLAAFRTLGDLESALTRINLSSTTPQILDVVNSRAASSILTAIDSSLTPEKPAAAEAFLVLGFDGTRKACDWQTRTIAEELHGAAVSVTSIATPHAVVNYCRAAMHFSMFGRSEKDGWWMRVVVPPSRVVTILQIAQAAGLSACGRAGNGIVYLHTDTMSGAEKIRDEVTQLLTGSAGHYEIRDGNSVVRYPEKSLPVERYVRLLTELLG